MELTIYDVIKGPVISDKAYKLNKKLNQLVLEVHPLANKSQIKQALEKLFSVKVDKVRTSIKKDQPLSGMGRRYIARPAMKKIKKAFVTLAEGYSLKLFDQATTGAPEEKGKKSE